MHFASHSNALTKQWKALPEFVEENEYTRQLGPPNTGLFQGYAVLHVFFSSIIWYLVQAPHSQHLHYGSQREESSRAAWITLAHGLVRLWVCQRVRSLNSLVETRGLRGSRQGGENELPSSPRAVGAPEDDLSEKLWESQAAVTIQKLFRARKGAALDVHDPNSMTGLSPPTPCSYWHRIPATCKLVIPPVRSQTMI